MIKLSKAEQAQLKAEIAESQAAISNALDQSVANADTSVHTTDEVYRNNIGENGWIELTAGLSPERTLELHDELKERVLKMSKADRKALADEFGPGVVKAVLTGDILYL